MGRKVESGLREAGREVKEFGSKVAKEVEEWLAAQKREEAPGALKQVQPRQTLGVVERVLKAPDSPLRASESLLAVERAMALRARLGPQRSLLVVPFDEASQPGSEYWFPVGHVVLEGLRPAGAFDLQTVLPWACDGRIRAARITLEAEPGSAEGSLHLEAADGTPFVTVPAKVEWFGKVLWPGQTELRVQRQPTSDAEGLIDIRLISAVPGGAARIEFTLPLVPSDEPAAPPAPAEEGTTTPTEPT